MSVSLSKGQRVDLTKGRPSLKNIFVGLGWDINHYDGEADFDLDASAFMTKANGKVRSDGDFIFYGNLSHSSKSVIHMGDNRTGEGMPEQLIIPAVADLIIHMGKFRQFPNIMQQRPCHHQIPANRHMVLPEIFFLLGKRLNTRIGHVPDMLHPSHRTFRPIQGNRTF